MDTDADPTGGEGTEATGGTMMATMSSSGPGSEGSTDGATKGSSAESGDDTGAESGEAESSSESGTLDPLCGNGELDDGEACDDGNDIDGDGCNIDCVESGTTLLTLTYDDSSHGSDVGRGVAVAPDGDFVVVGSVERADLGQGLDGWIRKYTEDGDVVWTDTYNNANANDHDVFYGVDVAEDGAIAVAGYEIRADVGQSHNVLVRTYDADGNVDWTSTYNSSTANDTDLAHGVGFDSDGNVYAGGYVARFDIEENRNIWVSKYDPTGANEWMTTYNNPDDGQDRCREFRTDSAGNSVCAGYEYRADLEEGFNHLIVKLSPDGDVLWTHAHHGANSTSDTLWAVAISDDGDIIGAGAETREDLGQGANIWVRRLDADGNELWTRTQDGPASMDDVADAAVIDGAGNVIVVGNVSTGVDDRAAWVRKFDPDGDTLWTHVEDLGDGVDSAVSVDVWPDGRIVVAGYEDATADGESNNIWIRVYAP
jgi:uncharacterized delta-60 repeat protein